MPDRLTSDPYVVIEDQHEGYVRYRNIETGARWEVRGVCNRRGDCLIGAIVDNEQIRDHEHLALTCKRLGRERIDSELDVVVAPGFMGCCPFEVVELDDNDQ